MASLAEFAVQSVVTISGGGAFLTALNAYFSRRTTRANIAAKAAETGKTSAEITNVGAGTANLQVDTSLGLLREMRIDLERIREEAATAREERQPLGPRSRSCGTGDAARSSSTPRTARGTPSCPNASPPPVSIFPRRRRS
jgi:hypothetical protein